MMGLMNVLFSLLYNFQKIAGVYSGGLTFPYTLFQFSH